MTYEITLLSADIQGAQKGEMNLGLVHKGTQLAEVQYRWTDADFTAKFVGLASAMPVPAHPTEFISRPIAAIRALMTPEHRVPSDVFGDNRVHIHLQTKG